MTRCVLAALGMAVVVAPVRSGNPADVAELFPAETLAYAELTRPGATADALAALFAQSPLADLLTFAHDRQDEAADPARAAGVRRSARLGLLGSPEVLEELKRTRGGAVGLIGFTDQAEARFAAVLMTGDSPLFGLVAKSYLTAGPNLRRVAVTDGVPVFQHRLMSHHIPGDEDDGNPPEPVDRKAEDKPAKPEPAIGEPTYAWVPGLFVVGSDVDAIADVLRRYAGKAPGPSLAASADFRSARIGAAGLFVYSEPHRLLAAWDLAAKRGEIADPDGVAWPRFLANPSVLRRVSGHLLLKPDAVRLTAEIDSEPGRPCPALDLIGNRLAFAPALGEDVAWAVTIALPLAERRADCLLNLADACAAANGAIGRKPSEAVGAVNGFDCRELLAGVDAVTVFLPGTQELPVGVRPWPVLVAHTPDAVGAERLARAIPELVRLFAGATQAPQPSAETVAGVRVRSVPGAGLPWAAAVHYTHQGTALAVGMDRKVVASAVKSVANPTPPGLAALGLIRPAVWAKSPMPMPKASEQGRPQFLPGVAGWRPPDTSEPLAWGLARSAKHLPPIEVTGTRSGGVLRLEANLREPVQPLGAAIRDLLLWLETQPVPEPDPDEPHFVEDN